MSTEISATSTEPGAIGSSGNDDEGGHSVLVKTSDNDQSDGSTGLEVVAGSALIGLPLQLDVMVPVPSFRVEHLLALEKGIVLESQWHHADDLPLWCGGTQLAWTEFEMVDQKLAVRVTRVS